MQESIKHIGKALKEARLKKGLSQRALGIKTKTSQNHISKIENGEVDLQASTLIEISRALNLELLLIPANLLPTVQALLDGKIKKGGRQTPMYTLDMEEEDE